MSLAARYVAAIVSLVVVACLTVSAAVLIGALDKSITVLDQDAGLTAILVAEIAEDDPATALQRAVSGDADVLAVALYGPNLNVIASKTAPGSSIQLPSTAELKELLADGDAPHTQYLDGSILALTDVRGESASYALVILNTDVTANALADLLRYAFIATLVLCAIAVFVAIFISRRLTRPLTALTQATVALSDGKFSAEALSATSKRTDEVGALARQFTSMAQEVQQRQARMAKELQALQVQIDETERRRSVDTITSTETFAELERRAAELRARRRQQDSPTQKESKDTYE